jgi:hypothetical protein
VQAEFKMVIPPGAAAIAIDQNYVGVIADGEVRGVPGGRGEALQVRRGNVAQFQRAEHGKSQVKRADAEPVLARRLVLIEVAQPGEGGYVAMRRAPRESKPLG